MRFADLGVLLREMGPGWIGWRSAYELGLRSGWLRRRFPGHDAAATLARRLGVAESELHVELAERWARTPTRFFVRPAQQGYASQVWNPDGVREIAGAVMDGRFLFFGRWWADLGRSPDWLLHPVNGMRYSNEDHWTEVPDLSAENGDIKFVWEASRFTHAFHLSRAYAATGGMDERYPETFWRHFEEWVEANPLEMGPQWRCAQEVSLRAMSWVFALYAFRESAASTPARVGSLLAQLRAHAEHVRRIHWYATRCIRNDHVFTEAAALFTLGVLFPFLSGADRWREIGTRSLVREADAQIYADGSYVLHSFNYARVVAQVFSWVLAVARANEIRFPDSFLRAGTRLLDFLLAMQDEATGKLPGYGSNDGALIFPLSSCDYSDFRPALHALGLSLGRSPGYGPGPWEEEAVWFAAPPPPEVEPGQAPPQRQAFPVGGYYTLRGKGTFAMIRCGSYRHRPVQADMLHLDVWRSGHNVMVDAGTYSYNPPAPWRSYFIGTPAHNTVCVDGADQMKKASRFLWLNWTRSRVFAFEPTPDGGRFEGEHYGYSPVVHRRQVTLERDVLVVVDDLFGDQVPHDFRIHWMLGDFAVDRDELGALIRLDEQLPAVRLALLSDTGADASWVRADLEGPRGWQSRYYGELSPAWSVAIEARGIRARFVTLLGPPGGVEEEIRRSTARWFGGSPPEAEGMLSHVESRAVRQG